MWKRVREEIFPSLLIKLQQQQKISSYKRVKHTHTHTHTHTQNKIDYLGFFLSLYILNFRNRKFFVLIFECKWGGVNVYSYLCRFLSFPLLFFFVSFVFFFFSSFLFLLLAGSLWHFFFLPRPFAPRLLDSLRFSYFFVRLFFFPSQRCHM